MLPAKIDEPRKWVAGPGGEVVPYSPPPKPVPVLDKYQKHRAMRIGLAHVLTLLKAAGFETNPLEQSVLCFRYKRFNFDVSIRKPAQIAYVTSSHDYKYNPNAKPIAHDIHGQPIYRPQATVKLASDEMKSDYVVQIIGAGVASINPIYVDLPDGIAEPEKYIIKNVIGVIGSILADKGLIAQMEQDTSGMLKEITVDDSFLLMD